MSLCGIGIIILAIVIARFLNTFYPLRSDYVKILEYTGYIGWCSTLGMLGWEIQTWVGNTSPERLNWNLAKMFSIIGIFAFVLARELIPIV